jgi:hypothetical protein
MFACTLAARYGKEYTISLSNLYKWKILVPAVLAQVIGQIFEVRVYPVTSNAGDLTLLIGATFFLYLAQDDLILTARFADFLHQSNAAFENVRVIASYCCFEHALHTQKCLQTVVLYATARACNPRCNCAVITGGVPPPRDVGASPRPRAAHPHRAIQ